MEFKHRLKTRLPARAHNVSSARSRLSNLSRSNISSDRKESNVSYAADKVVGKGTFGVV